jgi:hypothetical protein
MSFASWFGSRGRLRERSGTEQAYRLGEHHADACSSTDFCFTSCLADYRAEGTDDA